MIHICEEKRGSLGQQFEGKENQQVTKGGLEEKIDSTRTRKNFEEKHEAQSQSWDNKYNNSRQSKKREN